jgi:hypothetical protein
VVVREQRRSGAIVPGVFRVGVVVHVMRLVKFIGMCLRLPVLASGRGRMEWSFVILISCPCVFVDRVESLQAHQLANFNGVDSVRFVDMDNDGDADVLLAPGAETHRLPVLRLNAPAPAALTCPS